MYSHNEKRLVYLGLYETAWILERHTFTRNSVFFVACSCYNSKIGNN